MGPAGWVGSDFRIAAAAAAVAFVYIIIIMSRFWTLLGVMSFGLIDQK